MPHCLASSVSNGRKSASSVTVAEKLCSVLIPISVVVDAIAGCFNLRPETRYSMPFSDAEHLALDTPFNVNEIEALNVMFNQLSNSLIKDSLIHKEELQLALFNTPLGESIFVDRVFDLFDKKRNGVIEFDEFVNSLSIFHPKTPLDVKIDFAFRIYDLRKTGYIEREEVKQMIVAILQESDTTLSDEILEDIIDKTFLEADIDKDGKINREDWGIFVSQHPFLLKNMTLHCLKDVTTIFPSFAIYSQVDD